MAKANNTLPSITQSSFDKRYQGTDAVDIFQHINENLLFLRSTLNSEDLYGMTGAGLSNFVAHTQDLVDLLEHKHFG